MRYCKKCGKQLEDNALFCSNCGTKNEIPISDETVTEDNINQTPPSSVPPVQFITPDEEGQTNTASQEMEYEKTSATPLKKKKKGKNIVFAAIAAIVVVIATGAIVYAKSDSLQNSLKMAFMEPDKYLRGIAAEAFSDIASETTETYHALKTPVAAMKNENAEMASDFNLTLALDESFTSSIFSALNMNNIQLKNLSANINSNTKGGNTSADISIFLNDSALVTLKSLIDISNKNFYFQIPELSSSYLKINMNDFNSFNNLPQTKVTNIFSSLPAIEEKELERIVKDYSDLIVKMLTNVTVEKDVTAKVDDVTSTYNKFTASISEQQIYDFAVAFLTAAKEDEVLLNFLDSVRNTSSAYSGRGSIESTKSEIERALESLLSETVEEPEKIAAIYYAWIDESGSMKGQELSINDAGSIGYLTTQSKDKKGIHIWLKEDGQELLGIQTSYITKDGAYSGSASLSVASYDYYYEDYQTTSILLDFSNFSYSKNKMTGTFTLSTDALPGSSLTLDTFADSESLSFTLDVAYLGMKLGTISLTGSKQEPSVITFPNDSDQIYSIESTEEVNRYFNELDVDGFINKLNNLLGFDITSILNS